METSIEVDKRLMDVDFIGTVALTKAVVPSMIKNKGGQIVVVSSLMGLFGAPMRSGYAAAKHALHGFFDALRAELYNDKVLVTIICPGFVKPIFPSMLLLVPEQLKYNGRCYSQWNTCQYFCTEDAEGYCKTKIRLLLVGKKTFGVYLKRFSFIVGEDCS
jgi:short-subunit dehydrogenase